ncbi:MAG TPA: helix-hairpin-helix domain-containing protein [Geothermobacteraceae bacterium]|nr:helix-hairpin-helix domain-containing protein [Geothermobacteraceae bacterium]
MKKLALVLAVALFALPSFTFASSPATATETVASAPLNINQATAKELVKLPGIGKVTAERIIVFREANGPFVSIDDLLKVDGMGQKTLAKIRDQISLN